MQTKRNMAERVYNRGKPHIHRVDGKWTIIPILVSFDEDIEEWWPNRRALGWAMMANERESRAGK